MPPHISRLRLLPLVIALVCLAAGATHASGHSEKKFSVAALFFELNDTGRDLGIHADPKSQTRSSSTGSLSDSHTRTSGRSVLSRLHLTAAGGVF